MSISPELWEAEAHEPLAGRPWDEERARRTIAAIAADALEAYEPGLGWPPHPLDEPESPHERWQTLYLGAAGVIWALDELARRGAVADDVDWAEAARRAVAAYVAAPDTGEVIPSYLIGETGVLLLRSKLDDDPHTRDLLEELVRANLASPDLELLWGAPGTMRASLRLWERTGEDRWAELWREGAAVLWDLWHFDQELGCHVWVWHRRGKARRVIGAGHGLAGNVASLWDGRELLDERRRHEVARRAVQAVAALALEADGMANWDPEVGGGPLRVQWCHGAPGIVQSLWRLPPDPAHDELLVRAGRLVWQAGPLVKGPGLCHGTAGNGWAFLCLHARTGDPLWLGRARDFAMHAIAQRERQDAPRFTLWTGDLGVALFLQACLDADPRWPTLDVF